MQSNSLRVARPLSLFSGSCVLRRYSKCTQCTMRHDMLQSYCRRQCPQGPVAPPAVGGAGNNVTDDADVRVGTQIMMGTINRRLQELSDIKLQKKKAN